MERLNKLSSHLSLSYCSVSNKNNICVIVGMGPGISKSCAIEFAKHGYFVIMIRRNKNKIEKQVEELKNIIPNGKFYGLSVDGRKEEQVIELFNYVEREFGIPNFVLFNIGANVPSLLLDETTRKFTKIWEMACLSGFLVGREAARRMIKDTSEQRTIIFTGATASLRGREGFSAFGSAKAGLRSLAQSMSKELAPQGIHVCHIIIDGPVDNPQTREFFGNELSHLSESQFINPMEIGPLYFYLHNQNKRGWTFEIDIRTNTEKW